MVGKTLQKLDKISYRLRNETLTNLVRELAISTSNIVISQHAEDRMYERDIDYNTVLKILRTGEINYEETDERGDSVVRATKNVVSNREASVVTAVVDQKKKLILITVMWEDPK